MAFKKTTFTQFAFKNKRPIDIKRVTMYDDNTDYNNDRGKTFDGPDLDKGQGEPSLSLEIRCRTDEELAILLRNGMDEADEDGFTVTIKDGRWYVPYTGCLPSKVNPSHSADGKPVLKIDLDVTEVKPEFL